jgi:hypothetical protein
MNRSEVGVADATRPLTSIRFEMDAFCRSGVRA